ncbi:Formylglycine-generating enzyme, required for sulfatase activity, contains SUMF1/FGE domain [Thermomonospora echinospora]|uniref:Formylglycine-generating enzyme, required for sulfatase activity, contains SUMF1/FGE domain n=1 Tax=Thermomonospora echinospora TaxID=1992 RepID=A0A1H6DPB8_9ACTN|nr:SUMF1/EgtB/PvdO family nonheme iron enzyme [Thermomonospora echinospora]SEG87207.1 Formylglycine-generating enzyme, required for sulfatase activity, contains SUMF1/FGE domain [Thermomonospora echinospora]
MEHDGLLDAHDTAGDPGELLRLARELEDAGRRRLAATAYDRAHALDPSDAEVAEARWALLDAMSVEEHGIRFRYIPAGTFLMGSADGEPDERPVHPVRLDDYWMSEAPISWAAYCDLMGWQPPPHGFPPDTVEQMQGFHLHEENKIRLQYCEDDTTRAVDWHAHAAPHTWRRGDGEEIDSRDLFGTPPREDANRPWRYDTKPMVSVSWQDAEELCERLTTGKVQYRLPTEAEWERAARGGLIGRRYPWGDEPPTPQRCDFDRFDELSILPSRRLPPNGYGLYAMAGSVWEWTSDWYDAEYYKESPATAPPGPAKGEERVLRGGSWTDCAEAVTVSFRMSRGADSWRSGEWGDHLTPNIGFRLCRRTR